jgi:hypothetical protein
VKVRIGFFALSEPENVSLCVVEGGGGAGAGDTIAVAAELAEAEPAGLVAVTTTRIVAPTSALVSA